MSIDKSDIVQGKRTYKYSHTEEFVVCDKIWLRHIFKRVRPEGHWEIRQSDALMEFEPTTRPAIEHTGKRIVPPHRAKPKREQRKLQPTPPEEKIEQPPAPAEQESKPPAPKRKHKPKPKLHPPPKSIRDFVKRLGEDT